MLQTKCLVSKDLLEHGLRVVKRAVDGEGKHICRAGACHLPLLQRRDPAVRIKDENGHAGFAEQTVDGRRAGVPRCRAEHVERLPAHTALPLVEIAEQLQREILEGKRRPVKQLQHKQIVAELLQRSHGGMGELPVGPRDCLFQLRGFDVGRESLQELAAKVRVIQALQAAEFPR